MGKIYIEIQSEDLIPKIQSLVEDNILGILRDDEALAKLVVGAVNRRLDDWETKIEKIIRGMVADKEFTISDKPGVSVFNSQQRHVSFSGYVRYLVDKQVREMVDIHSKKILDTLLGAT